jgi:hypothetical protein
MIIDAFMKISSAQSLTATAASTDHIDFGSDREIGAGEPMALVVSVPGTVTAGSVTALTITWQVDDNSGFSSPRAVAITDAIPIAEVVTGARWVIPLPADYRGERYARANYTFTGSGGTIPVDAFVVPLNMVDKLAYYNDAVTITG